MNTIAAISTPAGIGGIGIVRISGENSLEIVSKIFKSKDVLLPNSILYGKIFDGDICVDEVLVSYFRAPKTYTGEDVCEINCHGGNFSVRAVLDVALKNGAVLAEPGEFTKRAFINGKLDLSQAEAVIDLINSKSDKENRASLRQLQGFLGREIAQIKSEIVDLLVDIEANIDYPEYDIEEVRREHIYKVLGVEIDKLKKLLDSFENGKILREGITTAIIGRPNVGKSSLLNALLKEDRAIVTEIPGTTRDTIEEFLTIRGVLLKIIDTAGIHETMDVVESIGIEKSRKMIDDAQLILVMFDATTALNQEDRELLESVRNKKHIVIINKTDIGNMVKASDFNDEYVISISAKNSSGLEKLEDAIEHLFNTNSIEVENENIITNMRHKNLILEAYKELESIHNKVNQGIPIDMLSIEMQEAIRYLGEIIGESISEDVIKGIFSKFCVGK